MANDGQWIDDFFNWHDLHPNKLPNARDRLPELGINNLEVLAVWTNEEMPVPEVFVELISALNAEAIAKIGGDIGGEAASRRKLAVQAWIDAKEGILSDLQNYILNNPKKRSNVKPPKATEEFTSKLLGWMKAEDKPIYRNQILRKFQRIKAPEINTALAELIKSGQIVETRNESTGGRPTSYFTIVK